MWASLITAICPGVFLSSSSSRIESGWNICRFHLLFFDVPTDKTHDILPSSLESVSTIIFVSLNMKVRRTITLEQNRITSAKVSKKRVKFTLKFEKTMGKVKKMHFSVENICVINLIAVTLHRKIRSMVPSSIG